VSADAAGYDYFDVEADVGIHAWGPNLADAFAHAAVAAFALSVDPADVEPVERREVRAQAESREELLVNWINECLYVHEIEGFVVRRVEVDACDGGMVHGVLHGEEFDQRRHRPGTIVKAATFHQVAVSESRGRFDVRLVVDI
jgi:SHS2 domain-containing protein